MPIDLLLRFLGENQSAKAASAEVREAVKSDTDQIVSQSKAGSAEMAKATQGAAAVSTQAVATTTREVRNTGQEFANTARLASSAGRGIENALRGNVLAALRNFSIASRTAFKPDGPLEFLSGVNAVSAASQQAQAVTAGFSTAILSLGKNTAASEAFFKRFGIQAETALLNPSLAAQKFVAGLAQVESAEARAVIVQNLYGASSAKQLPLIEAQIVAQGQQEAALSKVLAAEAELATLRASETALLQRCIALQEADAFTKERETAAAQALAAVEAETTVATEALATAEAELAAVQGEVAVSSGLSAGAIGLIVIAVAALLYGLYKLLTAQKEVVIVTKDQIETTERLINASRQELEIAERMSAATEEEKQRRQALIETKKQELELKLKEQKEEEQIASHALSNALDNEATTRKYLVQAIGEEKNASVLFGFSLGEIKKAEAAINEELGKNQEVTKKAAEAVDTLSKATGKSKEEIVASELAHRKETDATGETKGAYLALVHALGDVVDAEGRLVPATDAATDALRQQIGVLADLDAQAKKSVAQFDLAAKSRNDYIDNKIKEIISHSGTAKQALDILQSTLREDQNFALNVEEQKGEKEREKAIRERLFPSEKKPKSAKEDPRIKSLEEQQKEAERVYKSDSAALKRKYELDIVNLEDYVKQESDLQDTLLEKRQTALRQELALEKDPEKQKTINDHLLDAQREHDDNIQKIKDDAAKKEIESLQKHLDALEKIAQNYDKGREDSIRALEAMRVKSHQEAELEIAAIEESAAQRRYEALVNERERLIQAAGGDPAKANQEKLRAIQAELDLWAAQERRSTIDIGDEKEPRALGTKVLERQRRIAEAGKKDLEEEKKFQDEIAALEQRSAQRRRDNDRAMYEYVINSPYSSIGQKKAALALITDLDLQELDEVHRHNIELLNAQEAQAIAEIGALEDKEKKKQAIRDQYAGLKTAEDARHSGARQQRQDKGDEDVTFAGASDPFGAVVGQMTSNANIIQGAGQIISSTFNSIGQAVGNAVKGFILFGSVGGSFRKFAAETIASIAQMAVVQAISEGALAAAMYGLFYFTGSAHFLKSAIAHGEAALAFGLVAGAATGIGRLAAGNSFAQDQQGAGGGVAGGSGSGVQYAAFAYNSPNSFSASQASGVGSRTNNLFADLIASNKQVVASNNQVANHVAALYNKIDSVPGGDLIRANPYAVGDGLRSAFQSGHDVLKDVVSAGSIGRV
jgi:hypothetical protein